MKKLKKIKLAGCRAAKVLFGVVSFFVLAQLMLYFYIITKPAIAYMWNMLYYFEAITFEILDPLLIFKGTGIILTLVSMVLITIAWGLLWFPVLCYWVKVSGLKKWHESLPEPKPYDEDGMPIGYDGYSLGRFND
jgi:hypothetical protein